MQVCIPLLGCEVLESDEKECCFELFHSDFAQAYVFSAEDEASLKEWVNVLRKTVWRILLLGGESNLWL